MAKNKNNSNVNKGNQNNNSSGNGKGNTSSQSNRTVTSKQNNSSRGKNSNEAESHFNSIADRRNNTKNNNYTPSNATPQSHRKGDYSINNNNNNNNNNEGNTKYNNQPINDPPYDGYDDNLDYSKEDLHINDADMTFTEEEIYGNNESNNYYKQGNNDGDADMTFTEEEIYGNSSQSNNNNRGNNQDADMTFTEEEIYGNSNNNRTNRFNTPSNRVPDNFETCTTFETNYNDFRETLVRNSTNLRRTMISRSNTSHIGSVIDRTNDLRNIHREYVNAGTRPGDRLCLTTQIFRDQRRHVEYIRFVAPNMHNFNDEPVTANTEHIQRRELNMLHSKFTAFTNYIISTITTYFGSPDSHNITLASAISMYCNNMIRLSRGQTPRIPTEASRSINIPHVNRAFRDWNALTNNDSNPALQGQDQLIISRYRAWAKAVLLVHGNTTDPATINHFVNTFNGYPD